MKDSCYKMMSLAYLLALWFVLTAAQSQNENENSGCQTYEVFLEQKTFLEGEDFKWKCSHTFSAGKPTEIGFYTRVTETDPWNDTVKFESGTVGYQSVPLDDLVVIGPGNNGCYEDGCQITMHSNASMYLHWRCHVITDTCAEGKEATTQLILTGEYHRQNWLGVGGGGTLRGRSILVFSKCFRAGNHAFSTLKFKVKEG